MARGVRIDHQKLESLRIEAKLTQEELWAKLGIVNSTYRKILDGERVELSTANLVDSWVKKRYPDHASLVRSPNDPPPAQPLQAPDFTRYLAHTRDECGSIEVRGIVKGGKAIPRIPISDLYVPLTTTGARTLESALNARLLLVMGDPGSGKSTFLRREAWARTQEGATQFPILIHISELEEHIRNNANAPRAPAGMRADWLKHYLAARSDLCQWGLSVDDFHQKLHESSTVVLLDGLDEAPDSQRRANMAQLFLDAVRVYRGAHFVVTTRPAAPEFEALASNPEFHTVAIGRLDSSARKLFLDRWSNFLFPRDEDAASRNAEALAIAIEARAEIRRMANNPLMLTVVAIVHWNEKTLPAQRAELYESILNRLAKAREKPGRLDAESCLRILGVLALATQCRRGGRVRQMSFDEAAEALAASFRADEHGRAILPGRRIQAALDFLEAEMVDSGIVLRRGRNLEFWHLTFQEYLAARACRGVDRDELMTFLFEERRLYWPEWREVMLLLGGVLIRDGDRKVNAIFTAVLSEAARDGSLAAKALAVRLLGAILRDLRHSRYYPEDSRYDMFLRDALGVFKLSAAKIPLKIRVDAAKALGRAGDPRLRDPRTDDDYWVEIPAGTLVMGAQSKNKKERNYDPEAIDDEGPVREIEVKAFRMGRYPVTVEEYRFFLDDHDRETEATRSGADLPRDWDTQVLCPNRPVTGIGWDQAMAYSAWAGCRLPREHEWEWAARGKDGRRYPWGREEPNPSRANYDETGIAEITPVGMFPAGATPDGIEDLVGNVWEWTGTIDGSDRKVLRGGCWDDFASDLRASYRYGIHLPGYRDDYIRFGFRLVRG